MKKILVVLAAVVLVLSFAGAALAIHAEIPAETQAVVAKGGTQITLGGEIRVRGWYTDNIATGSAEFGATGTTRTFRDDGYGGGIANDGIRQSNELIISTSTTTYTYFKSLTYYLPTDENYAGKEYWNYRTDTGIGTDGVSRNAWGWYYAGSTDSTKTSPSKSDAWWDQRVRLNLDAQVAPNVKGYVQLETGAGGSDVFTWGNFNTKPTDMHILQAWIQYNGTGLFGFNSGVKVGHMPLKLGEGQFFDHTQVGDDAVVFFMDPTKQLHIGLLAIKFAEGLKEDNTDDLDGYVGLMTYKINDKNTVGLNYTYINQSDTRMKFQNLGVHANGGFGNFGYKGEVDFQFGKLDEMKYRGWGLMLAGNYKVNPVNIRASFAYGSGDKDAGDNKIGNFKTFVGGIQHYTLIYDYRITTADLSAPRNTGISNTTYYNIGADFDATKNLSLSGDLYLLRASKAKGMWGQDVSKNLGWEFDAALKYKLAKNLTYVVDGGYFKPGAFYEDVFGIDKKGVVVLRNILTLSF